jgi:hypothetical protein
MHGVPQDLDAAVIWFNRAAGNPVADQATRDDAIYNREFIAKSLNQRAEENAGAAQQMPRVGQQRKAGASVAQQPQKLSATVVVWHNFGDAQEGSKLVQAGVDKTNPALLRRLVSCIAHEGAGYVVTEGGFYGWSNIIIVDGDQVGCRGTILTR